MWVLMQILYWAFKKKKKNNAKDPENWSRSIYMQFLNHLDVFLSILEQKNELFFYHFAGIFFFSFFFADACKWSSYLLNYV